ncbi:MAG TPA: chromosome segregation protein SMC, partial [Candidatus Omnitrophota bacterium]|nr:chromosome segregation protein SMC [Candidatus Omnitrophota bacterium]
MHFKKLEIVGFKSFLNKTALKFEPGVTAIVGPNGCGKSNVVDSIKWVFGEQSPKSMRSSSMQDVIFNGTDKFEAVNMAEVSITLSNEERSLPVDFDEVTITRRLFRSGESEYLLNKTPVRLLDVRGILSGTGLGTSSYSVIEQGKMDLILSSKPEDRRYVFEEASGITRFKTKKKEALGRLERTQENLTRINDIIREVERQVKSIERQARKAERYKGYYEELKDLELKLANNKFRELEKEIAKLTAEYDSSRANADAMKQGLEAGISELSEKRDGLNKLIEALQFSQSEVMRLSSDIDKNEHVVTMNRERIEELKKTVEKLTWEIDELTRKKESMRDNLAALETKYQDVAAAVGRKEQELLTAEATLKEINDVIEKYSREIKTDKDRALNIISEQTEGKNTLIRIGADIQNLQARGKRLELEKSNVDREKETVLEKLKSLDEILNGLRSDLESRKSEFDSFNREFIEKQQRLSIMMEEKFAKEKRINEVRPRIEFLEKLISEREGMSDSVKEVMKRVEAKEDGFAGVRGILSEVINVKEGYEESLEAVLGDFSEAIVVDDRSTAECIIKFLSDNGMGSVSFVVLSELMAQGVETGIIPQEMSSLVTASDSAYIPAVREALKGVAAFSQGDAWEAGLGDSVVVCEKGELHKKGMHRSRNFSQKEVVSIFGRHEKLDHMRQEEGEVALALGEICARIAELDTWLKSALTRREELESQLRLKQVEFADVSSRRMAIKEKCDSLDQEILVMDSEIRQEMANLDALKADGEKVNVRLNQLEEERFAIEAKISDSQKVLTDKTSERENAIYRISDARSELSSVKKEEEHLSGDLAREKEIFSKIDSEVEGKYNTINECKKRNDILTEESKQLAEKNIEYARERDMRLAESVEKREQKDVMAQEITGMAESVKQRESGLEETRNEIRDLEIKLKELSYKVDAIKQKVQDSYKLDIMTHEVVIPEYVDWTDVEARIAALKDQMEKLGEVSLGAVEEHKQLEERFAFLTKQRDDLTKGREDLLSAITKINRTTREMFMEAFEKIR